MPLVEDLMTEGKGLSAVTKDPLPRQWGGGVFLSAGLPPRRRLSVKGRVHKVEVLLVHLVH